METNWLWDKNLTEDQAKAVLADNTNPKFILYAALLLSRVNSAKDVFRDFISKKDFFSFWTSIKRQMRKDSWNNQRIDYWQAIYDTLKQEMPELKESKDPLTDFPEEVTSIAREIGSKVKILREEARLTQKDLAKRLNISQQIISRIESGRQNVSIETLDSICLALGVSVAAVFRDQSKESEKIVSIFPFSSKSPEEFVQLVFAIVERSKEYSGPQYYDGTSDKGRDVVAYKYGIGRKEKWYFQCKRYQRVGFSDFKKELDKISIYSKSDPDFLPHGIVFATACKVSSPTKDRTTKYAKEIGILDIEFWTDIELTAKAKASGVYDELFPVTNKSIKENAEDIKKHQTNLFLKAGWLTETGSKKDTISEEIKEAVTNIHEDNIERAKQILLKVEGEISDRIDKYKEDLVKVYNNLGVCYNRFAIDQGDFDQAEKYLNLALNLNPSFVKAKINLASVYLNRNGAQDYQKAHEIASSLWKNSDKKDPAIFEVYFWSKVLFQSPQEAINFYETSTAAQSLVNSDEKLLGLLALICFNQKMLDRAFQLVDQALNLSPDSVYNLMLKARIFMQKAQTEDIISNAFEIIPKFKTNKNIQEAISFLNKASENLEKNTNSNSRIFKVLKSQIQYDLSICMLWLRQYEEYKTINVGIQDERLDSVQQSQRVINDILLEIQNRNFEVAVSKLKQSKDWPTTSYKEKAKIAHSLFLKGAPQQSKDIFLSIEKEAEEKKDVWFCIDMSLNEVLLDNKNMAIKYAEKAKNLGKETAASKVVLSHYGALTLRYARNNEVDRFMTGLSEYADKFPEDKVMWSIKAIEEDGSLSEEFKSMLLKQKKWYEDIKQKFRDEPVPSYFLEKILNRTYVEILSFRNWDELDFIIELNVPDKSFEETLLNNFDKAEKIVFDYASLLNLAKMNLLGYLEKLGKEIYVSEKLFDKIQHELLQVEQEDLRNLWRFLKDSKVIHIIDTVNSVPRDPVYIELFDDWLIESIFLAKSQNAVFIVDDLRLIRLFQTEENIKVCNSFFILKNLLNKQWIDLKIYSTSIGDLAERFYTFLPFSADDLFQIAMEDKSKVTLRSYHLISQIFLPGSIASSFTSVFVRFIDLLWKTGSLPEDKVDWLSFLTEKITKFVEQQIGDNKGDFDKIVPDFVQMWVIAIQQSRKDEIILLEKRVDQLFKNKAHDIFKENVLRFIKAKAKSLGLS